MNFLYRSCLVSPRIERQTHKRTHGPCEMRKAVSGSRA